jgi:hypothetical protein
VPPERHHHDFEIGQVIRDEPLSSSPPIFPARRPHRCTGCATIFGSREHTPVGGILRAAP